MDLAFALKVLICSKARDMGSISDSWLVKVEYLAWQCCPCPTVAGAGQGRAAGTSVGSGE